MAHAAAYTSSSAVSTTFYPVDTVSELIVEGTFTGVIELQRSRPGANSWKNVALVKEEQDIIVRTPDPNMEYRVKPSVLTGTANVYFGP